MTEPEFKKICAQCGNKHGNRKPETATFMRAKCSYCGEIKHVTAITDFGVGENWICGACGRKYGKRIPIGATVHYGTCDWCKLTKGVSDPSDYGIGKKRVG